MAYTNSSLVAYTKLSPNHSGQRTHSIDRITPHCVVGQCTVETLGDIFYPTSRQASCQYGIGKDGKVGMYVEEKNRSWCSSSNANDQRAITIECASDTTAPYAMNDKVYATLINLCTDICKRKDKQREWMKNYMAQDDTRFTPFTTRVKCGCCGNSCRRASQPSRTSPNGKVNYWRCKTASKCGTKGIREEELKSITAAQMGLTEFDGTAFREQVECITVLPDFKLEFSFTDGHTQTAEFSQQKKGHAWTEEQRAKYMESTKSSYTPERRKAMSEKMKKIRSEKHWSSTGKGTKKEEENG